MYIYMYKYIYIYIHGQKPLIARAAIIGVQPFNAHMWEKCTHGTAAPRPYLAHTWNPLGRELGELLGLEPKAETT